MPRYIEIDAERLSKIHDGLDLLEALDRSEDAGALRSLDLHLYGISTNPQVIDAAKEAIADANDVAEEDVALAEVAVAIPLNADTIYALSGSGIKLEREEFAYMGSGGEGVRSLSFTFGHYKPRVALSYFSKLAIASSDSWLDDFLRKQGSGQAAVVTPAVHRDQEATQPQAPVAPATPAPAGVPKQTSLRQLAALLDDYLD